MKDYTKLKYIASFYVDNKKVTYIEFLKSLEVKKWLK